MQGGEIEHEGVITKKDSSIYSIGLLNVSACASCHAKSACSVSEVDNKIIEISAPDQNLKVGEHVQVVFQKSLGPKALFLGYLLPFLILMTTLLITNSLLDNEVTVGLLALSSIIPYYLVLAFFRKRLSSNFEMNIKPLSES